MINDDWRGAAMKFGERLCPIGPDGYYDFTADQWLEWAEQAIRLTDEEIEAIEQVALLLEYNASTASDEDISQKARKDAATLRGLIYKGGRR